jgi:radical SAM superfamily enzyme YgiQ (UPF0313 family)
MPTLPTSVSSAPENNAQRNVLLLSPEFPDTFWGFKHALKFIRKKATLPPLGLLTVAAILPKGWGKRLVDLNVRRLTEEDLAWADLVFVGAMIAQRDSTRALIARCHAAGLKVVAGGPLFTGEHELFPEVDHFVLNEAEVTLPPFLRDLERGQAQRMYASPEFPNLEQTPSPLWELADLKRYASMSLQYSRGCPFDCEFCNVTAMFGHRPRTKTPAQVIAELDGLYALGWRGQVFFVDDNFIGNKQRLKTDLLPALVAWQEGKRGIPFYTEASINLADDADLMGMMAKAGFDSVFVGIETPDAASLHECNKRQNEKRDLVADVKRIQRAGLQVQGGFIVGFDHDTPSIFQRQVEFIQKSGIVTAMVGMLNALPDTKLYARLLREGRLLGRTTGNNVDGTTNIVPRMNAATLAEGYRSIMRTIYSPGPYYRRIRTFLREYQPVRFKTSFRFANLRTFFHSSVRLGIFGRERFHYWGLLAWTFFRRRRALPLAITLSIYGHHFRKTCKTHGL